MSRRHAISLGFSGHYQNLGIPGLKSHYSACNFTISVDGPPTVGVGGVLTHVERGILKQVTLRPPTI